MRTQLKPAAVRMAYLPSYRQSDKDELDELEAIEREVSLAHQQVERVEILLQREEAKAGEGPLLKLMYIRYHA